MRELGFENSLIGQLKAVESIGTALGFGPWVWRSPRLPLLSLAIIGQAGAMLSLVGLSDKASAHGVYLLRSLFAIVSLGLFGRVVAVCPPQVVGSAYALVVSASNLAVSLGAVVGGTLYDLGLPFGGGSSRRHWLYPIGGPLVEGTSPLITMGIFSRSVWVNFLGLLPGTLVTVLVIAVAFLRFYDTQDFTLLGFIAQPQLWSNRLTVAALLAALANFGVEWNRRNRETNRLAEEEQRRTEEKQRRLREENRGDQEAERAARRTRIQNRWIVLQIRYLFDPGSETQAAIADFLQFLQEYGEL